MSRVSSDLTLLLLLSESESCAFGFIVCVVLLFVYLWKEAVALDARPSGSVVSGCFRNGAIADLDVVIVNASGLVEMGICHMKSHQQQVMNESSIIEIEVSLSILENFYWVRKQKSMIKCIGTMNPSFLSTFASCCVAYELDETENVVRRLVTLAKDVACFLRVDSSVEDYDDSAHFRGVVEYCGGKNFRGNDGCFVALASVVEKKGARFDNIDTNFDDAGRLRVAIGMKINLGLLCDDEWLEKCGGRDSTELLQFLDIEGYELDGKIVIFTLSGDSAECKCSHFFGLLDADKQGSKASMTIGTGPTVYANEASHSECLIESIPFVAVSDYIELHKTIAHGLTEIREGRNWVVAMADMQGSNCNLKRV